jgi:hypothetical protein
VFDDELHALKEILGSSRAGDVVSVTALGQRPEIFEWLDSQGASRLGPADVKRLVRSVALSWA